MNLLIIRHAIAEEAENPTETDDARRALTSAGRRKMRRIAKNLVRLVDHIDLLVSSPLLRARQTADIIAAIQPGSERDTTDTLVPGSDPQAFLSWIEKNGAAELVAVVGHEPHLGSLITFLLCGNVDSRVELRKGGACLLSLQSGPRAGGATVQWLLTSRQLRRLDLK
jgi:phosphohistidine phosphatase